MIVDIFSAFDPATNSLFSFSSPLFWLSRACIFLILHPIFWLGPGRSNWFVSFFSSVINEQADRTLASSLKGFSSLLSALFILIISLNFCGILPYFFRTSSHLLFSLSIGLPLWLSLIISGTIYSPSTVAASLLPGGAPRWLNPFLVIVETARIAVRPITLSFRLAANLTAGHIVLGLVRTFLSYVLFTAGPISWISFTFIQTGYTIFEFGICIIQGYIFCLLLSLYADDHPSC